MTKTNWFLTILGVHFPLALALASSTLPVENLRCEPQISQQVWSWHKTDDWKLEGTTRKTKSYLAPTKKIGKWIELTVGENNQVTLSLRMRDRFTEVSWDSTTCQATTSLRHITNDRKLLSERFTDDNLQKLVSHGGKGMVYAWSPHMPLSLAGLKEAQRAAKKMHLKLTVVLDPHANEIIARRSATKNKWDPETLRKIESLELFNRKMCTHFPAILLYARGKMVGPVYAGYKPEKTYRQFIQRHLTAIQK